MRRDDQLRRRTIKFVALARWLMILSAMAKSADLVGSFCHLYASPHLTPAILFRSSHSRHRCHPAKSAIGHPAGATAPARGQSDGSVPSRSRWLLVARSTETGMQKIAIAAITAAILAGCAAPPPSTAVEMTQTGTELVSEMPQETNLNDLLGLPYESTPAFEDLQDVPLGPRQLYVDTLEALKSRGQQSRTKPKS